MVDGMISPKEAICFSLDGNPTQFGAAISAGDASADTNLAAKRKKSVKQVFDYATGAMAVVLLAPLLLGIALAVKLDSPGPVFFRQPRRGLDNRPFDILKFRTMVVHLSDTSVATQTLRRDPRVTRVGRWLRRFSLDELPQLFNVLRGEMSLVGPRPHALNTRIDGELLPALSSAYMLRYAIKPGITGWAQVNGARGALFQQDDLHKRLAYDLEYIENCSVGLDLKIMALTASREIFSKHAF